MAAFFMERPHDRFRRCPDAALARLVEAAEDQPLDHMVDAVHLVAIDDATRVAAELEHHFLRAAARLRAAMRATPVQKVLKSELS